MWGGAEGMKGKWKFVKVPLPIRQDSGWDGEMPKTSTILCSFIKLLFLLEEQTPRRQAQTEWAMEIRKRIQAMVFQLLPYPTELEIGHSGNSYGSGSVDSTSFLSPCEARYHLPAHQGCKAPELSLC